MLSTYHSVTLLWNVQKFKNIFPLFLRTMSSMKAVRIHTTGDPSVLKVETVPIPEITSNQVLVKVYAAGLNPVDTYIREKKFGYDPKLPAILGGEAAGEIVKTGSEISNKYKVGERVICALRAPAYGGYAEYAACAEADLIPLHSGLTYSQGAAVFVPYFTAYKALVARCNVKAQELVLVHGASGAVGVAAVQIARAQGAVVVGSAGSEDGKKLLKSLGVEIIVDHREDDHLQKALASAGRPGFDVILENRADVNLGKDLAALGPGGRVAVVGSRGPVEIDPRNFIRTEGCVRGVNLWHTTKAEFGEYSSALVAGMEQGWLRPVVGREYNMQHIQQAHLDLMKPNGACGKLVLKIR